MQEHNPLQDNNYHGYKQHHLSLVNVEECLYPAFVTLSCTSNFIIVVHNISTNVLRLLQINEFKSKPVFFVLFMQNKSTQIQRYD